MQTQEISPLGIFIILASWTFFGILTAYLANKKGRSPYIWFFIGFFLAIFGLLLILIFPRVEKEKKPNQPPPQITDTLWYYLDQEHKQHGPVSQIWLSQALLEKRINENTYVWNESLKDWEKVKDLKKDL